MKHASLVLGLILVFFSFASAKSNPPVATLNIGVYYTFEPTDEFETQITNVLAEAETLLNQEIFGSRKAISLKLSFLEHLEIGDPPIYKNENIAYSFEIDGLFSFFKTLKHPKADYYLMLTKPILAFFDKSEGHMTKKWGVTIGTIDTDKLIIMRTSSPNSDLALLLHETGHLLDLDHPDPDKCENIKVKVIMCPEGFGIQITFDEEYKKAWRDYYNKKTNQN